jgi:preprotein translocase subunit SecD
MRYPRLFIWLLIGLTTLSVIIVAPAGSPITFSTPSLPGINRSFEVTLPFGPGIVGDRAFTFSRGLDLAGGTAVTLEADVSGISSEQKTSALEGAKEVLERRVNLFGVSEPVVQTSTVGDSYRIIAELPGIDAQAAVRLIGTTAQLSFWEQGASNSAQGRDQSTFPAGITQILGPDATETGLTGNDLQQATVVFSQQNGQPEVQLVFSPEGARKFGEITSRNVGKPVVIVLDDQVLSFPVVQTPIVDGRAVITGQFTTAEAKEFAVQLQAGALPVPLSILSQTTIGATLGEASLQKSLFAGIVGFIVIAAFMIGMYGRKGIVATVALLLYALFTLAIFKAIPVTLTLAGIAGFILSIGMAVDANILIFERSKEEERAGKTASQAIALGFSRAWSSIQDSNVSTLITCLILYQFGTGIVKGFAFTLAIGVFVSMFSAIAVTRTLLRLLIRV